MFKERAIQLLHQRQNSNDIDLIKFLIDGFSNQDESAEFKAFKIPDCYSVRHVQEVLNLIDKRLFASSEKDKILISM